LKTALILALTSAAPEKDTGCATTNIEVALRHLFDRYKDGGTLDVARDSGEPITTQFIAESLKVRDVPNGYALIESPDLIETYEAALFKNPSGYHLVVVSSGASVSHTAVFRCDADGLKADNTALRLSDAEAVQLYTDAGLLKANAKKGLTEKTLQDWGGSIVVLSLPRKGRVITIKANVDEPAGVYGKKLGTIDYVDGRFVVHSLAKKKGP
jgi:hypothetical protein